MKKFVHIANAVLTVSFGIGAYLFPQAAFEPFGFTLDATGIMVTKGYASAAIGYGLVFWFSRNLSDPVLSRNFLIASTIFNGLEAILQLPIALGGLAQFPIWITAISHSVLSVLSLYCVFKAAREI